MGHLLWAKGPAHGHQPGRLTEVPPPGTSWCGGTANKGSHNKVISDTDKGLRKKKKKEMGDVIKKTSKGTMLVFYIAITWFEIHRAQNGIQ